MRYLVLLILALLCFSCTKKEPLAKRVWIKFLEKNVTADSLFISIEKVIPGPVSMALKSDDAELDSLFQSINPIYLGAKMPTYHFSYAHQRTDTSGMLQSIKANLAFGDPTKVKERDTLAWPFPRGKYYKVLQAYNGSFSHTGKLARYALDFNLSIGDTICAANDGLVMEVIKGYSIGGKHKKYYPYANVITIIHPDGYITQYVHMKKESAFVKPGDQVKKGQAIGLSGNTGFSAGPHLHFNYLKPIEGDVVSHPAIFEQRMGADLRRGMRVGH